MKLNRAIMCFALLGSMISVQVEGICSPTSTRTPCGSATGIITQLQCPSQCCYDTELLRPPYCFEQIDSENSVGAAGRLPGNAQNPPGRPYVPTTAAVQYGGPCLAHCTLVLRPNRIPCRSEGPTDMQSCVNAGCCYDSTDSIPNRRCYFAAPTSSSCPDAQCLIPSGNIQICARDNVGLNFCSSLGCCYSQVGSSFLCYRKEDPPTRFGVPISSNPPRSTPLPPGFVATLPATTTVATPTKKPTFLEALKGQTGGSLKEFSVIDLLTLSIPELVEKRNRMIRATARPTRKPISTTTTTTVSTTTGTRRATTTHPAFVMQTYCRWGRCSQYRVSAPPPTKCYPTECGKPKIYPGIPLPDNIDLNLLSRSRKDSTKKIVGGTRAHPFSHPWTAMILKKEGSRTFICGASVICKHWLVTAAHCLNKQSKASKVPDLDAIFYEIHVGRLMGEKYTHGKQVQIFRGREDIDFLEQHENFVTGITRGVITNDIAIIRLKKPIVFNSFVQPICLPEEKAAENKILWATGWGITKGQGPSNQNMKQLGVKILNETTCRTEVPGFENPSGVLCAGGEDRQDTCTGDSGGPLAGPKTYGRDARGYKMQKWHLYGLTSLGSPSCNTLFLDKQPALYTDVFYFKDWIDSKTSYCCA